MRPPPPPPPPPRNAARSEPTAPLRRDSTGTLAAGVRPSAPPSLAVLRPAPARIFLNREWYLPVDHDGYIDGLWFEGAFGCVLPMYHVHNTERLALKIPRLLADTVRENEFIRHIVETEAQLVAVANHRVAFNSGLVPTQQIVRDLLRGRRDFLDADDPQLAAQHGCILLFSFRKSKPPRVVSAKIDDTGQLVTFPPIGAEVTQFLTREIWEELCDPNARHAGAGEALQRFFREPYYFELKESAAARNPYGPMLWAMSPDREARVWYSALPSIIYKWAPGTLQRAVSQRAHMAWRLVDHYDLHRQIARGIATLHGKGLIHGDLRPANIMMMADLGTPDARERPEEYAVGDYGSFSVDRSRDGSGTSPAASGHTMTGAGVSRQRTSMFYAPERRHGYERENADVAIVHNPGHDTKYYMICLGWGSSLFVPGSTELRPELLAELKNHWNELLARQGAIDDPALLELPRDGDRLRLRDYVFEVRASKATPEMSLFLVDRRYAQVLHERVAVYSQADEELADGSVITLPMYTEIHQWSAATDIFGIGTLALYTLFMSSVQREFGGAEGFDESVNTRFESMVAELIGRLGNARDAVEVWGDLDLFWTAVEQLARAGYPSHGEQKIGIEHLPVPGHNITMVAFAIKTTNNLLRIKNMKHLLSCFRHDLVTPRDGLGSATHEPRSGALEYNLAHFLFFVHFLMSCIHRRHALEACRADGSYERILCLDRCEKPSGADSAAEQALQRLTTLQERVSSPDFRGFLVAHASLDFEYRAESEFQLQRRCKQLHDENAALAQLLSSLRTSSEKHLSHIQNLVARFARQRFRFLGINDFLGSVRTGLEQGLRALDPRVRTLPASHIRDSDETGADVEA